MRRLESRWGVLAWLAWLAWLPVAAQTVLIEGQDTRQPNAARGLPAYLQPYVDDAYGATVRRVSDAGIAFDRDRPSWVRHEYSRKPAFNVDSSRVLLNSSNGWMRLFERDPVSGALSFVKTLNLGEPQEPVWHPSDPHKIRHFGYYGAGLRIWEYDVRSDQSSVIADLGARLRERFPRAAAAWTKQEGRPSNDGRVWCLQVEDEAHAMLGLAAYDLAQDRLLGSLALAERPDHVSTSPLGRHCVPSWTGVLGTRAYATDFQSFRQLHSSSEHSDLALAADGSERYVYADYHSGDLAMVDLASGQRTPLFRLYGPNASATSLHVSGIGSELRPGWALVSTYGCSTAHGDAPCGWDQWFRDKLLLVQLAANPRIVNIAHNRWGPAGYFGEPQAVSNRDYSRLLFASSWERDSGVQAFLVDFNAALLGGVPPPSGLVLSEPTVQRLDARRVRLGLRSSLAASCRLSARSGSSFALLSDPFSASEGGRRHDKTIKLPDAGATTRWARCQAQGKGGAEAELALVIPAYQTPFTLSLHGLLRVDPYRADVELRSSLPASCRLATLPGQPFDALWDPFQRGADGLQHLKSIGLSGAGAHQRWVVCRSDSGQDAELPLAIP